MKLEIKICMKCRNEYPATLEYFYPEERVKCGLQARCKKCQLKAMRKYRQTEIGKRQQQKDAKRYYNTIKGHLRWVFNNIIKRCTNPKCGAFKNYGGRGIKNKFRSFGGFIDYVINELQIDPRGLQIDRINNDGHYEKGNIRFVTAKENANNRRKR